MLQRTRTMSDDANIKKMHQLDALFSHVWMVRTFLKHSEEAAEDDELAEVHRDLYDAMHALGAAYAEGDADKYLRQVAKKRSKLKAAAELFEEIAPEISTHMNFKMALRSLKHALGEIEKVLESE